MSDIKEALIHSEENAVAIKHASENNTAFPIAVLPGNMQIHNLEQYQENRNQLRGSLRTESIKDFVEYANAQSAGLCFINREDMSAKAIFDIGTELEPGHCKHSGFVELAMTAAYKKMIDMDGKRVDQQDLAEFVEDWRDDIDMFIENNDEPVSMSKAIASIRRVTITEKKEGDHASHSFSQNKSSMENIEAKSGDDAIPGFLSFECEPYHGLKKYKFTMRVSLFLSTGEPVFMLRSIKLEEIREEMAKEFHDLVTDDLENKIKPYMGYFSTDG